MQKVRRIWSKLRKDRNSNIKLRKLEKRDQQEDKAAKIEQERTEVQKDLESLQEATRQIVVTSLSLHIASTRDQGFSRRTEEPNLSYGAESVRHTAHQKSTLPTKDTLKTNLLEILLQEKERLSTLCQEQEQELVRLKDDTENAEKEVILLKNQLAPTEGRLHRHADEQITLSKEKVDLEKEVEHLREELEEKEGLNLTLKDQSRDSEEKQQAKAEKFMVFGCIQLD
ncbi:hypothetical protein BLNAU_24146 [Blattamonas nauphoetae]|uniref:Uncharacterized protein n=1 Tax=Blattamonas nauphoetae TaxID=2049346 RepID=A0ABQ9WNL4_9EUKA|nr:hypothetical protein BLNAU_24146 [Blattamonas nauphoetae]